MNSDQKVGNHLKGKNSIATRFGVSSRTVLLWIKDGAPIAFVGKKYQANYEVLMDWLVRVFPAHKKRS